MLISEGQVLTLLLYLHIFLVQLLLFTVVYFLLKNSISDLIDHKRILEGVQDLQDLYQ